MVINLPAMWDTWVRSLVWEDLEKGRTAHFSILAWRIPMDKGACQATVHGVTKSRTRLSDFHSIYNYYKILAKPPVWYCICF